MKGFPKNKRFDLGWLRVTTMPPFMGGIFVGNLIGKNEEHDGFARALTKLCREFSPARNGRYPIPTKPPFIGYDARNA